MDADPELEDLFTSGYVYNFLTTEDFDIIAEAFWGLFSTFSATAFWGALNLLKSELYDLEALSAADYDIVNEKNWNEFFMSYSDILC